MSVKKKILLLSDDIRLTTGVANISKRILLNTIGSYDWVQMAMGCNSPEPNIIDISESISDLTNVKNCYARLYETSGYGDAQRLRNIVNQESPDAILHMTDPHRWKWLYDIEHEIREKIPLMYYHVWDNTPFPKYLKSIYKSCDWIGCISKLTQQCVNSVYPEHSNFQYIPHGVDTRVFYKQNADTSKQHRIGMLGEDYSFVVFFNNTNIHRKQLLLTIESFSDFYRNKLSAAEKTEVMLLLHTDVNRADGSDINKVLDDLYPDIPVLISDKLVSDSVLNTMYNLSHLTINVASNEGFGLTTLESVATETPILISNTGGLSDQYNSEWAELIEPSVKSMVGTQQTPYIYSDICSAADVCEGIYTMFNRRSSIDMSNKNEFLLNNNFIDTQMTSAIENSITTTIENFKPRGRFKFNKVV